MNDKIQQDKDNALIEMIREREFVDLRIKLSMLIRQFNLREDQLLNKIKADNLKNHSQSMILIWKTLLPIISYL